MSTISTDIKYTFLPWLRRGIAAKIKEADNLNNFGSPPTGGWALERPEFKLRLKIEGKKGSTTGNDQVDQDISLIGPGDVLGIDQRAVVKHDPANWITNFEPNYFPYIEFYEEDFPWRYSPAKPNGHKLRPWLMLVVLEDEEFEREEGLDGPLPSIKVLPHSTDPGTATGATSSVWPNVAETWAWAHVHLNGDVDPTDNLDPNVSSDMASTLTRFMDIVGSAPDRGVSRIICPRKLSPNTRYHAFLVPTFEMGRLAGLGADDARLATVKAQEASWGANHVSDEFTDRWPVYYNWFFKTGAAGDFEHLVRQIVPRPVDPKVGKRPMDIQEAGYNVKYVGTPPFDGTLELEGALMAPGTTREAYPWTGSTDYRTRLHDLLNLSEDLMAATFPSSSFYYSNNPWGYTTYIQVQDDPVITPDLYGRWHALKNKVNLSSTAWFHELNLDPRNRAVAGLGTKFIRKNQDRLMDKAWDQLGEVIEANRQLRWGQFSSQVAHSGFAKHFEGQPAEHAVAMAGPVMPRIKAGPKTMYHKLKVSAMPTAMESPAFRKVQRPNGSVMKRLDPQQAVFTQNNLRMDVAATSMAPVTAKAVSSQQAYLPGNDVTGFLNSVISYSPTSTPIFGLSQAGGPMVPDLNQQTTFQVAVTDYQNYFVPSNWPAEQVGPAIDLNDVDSSVKDSINPLLTISKMSYSLMDSSKPMVMPAPERIVPVMAYPVFSKSMYEAVKEQGAEFLIPNLDLIPNNTITLLETNQRFVESFLVGANHEMGRELLWREFPTDQRGSYFRHFWDSVDAVNTTSMSEEDLAESILDIDEIHTWSGTSTLGTHNARPGIVAGNKLVLVIRGDLLKKYPNVVIYARKAKWQTGDTNYELARELDSEIRYPVFSAYVEPDIHFLGFDLKEDDARGDRNTGAPGWFFVLLERPGEIRFGVDLPPTGSYTFAKWDDLHQGNANFSGQHLSTGTPGTNPGSNLINGKAVIWGDNSTNFAQILYQNPVMVCIHAHEMLPNP